MQNKQNLIWIDLEMTGLDPDTDVIIEMATIITDSELNTLAEGPVLAIHQSDEVLNAMDDWNRRQHGGSGLAKRVRESKRKPPQDEAPAGEGSEPAVELQALRQRVAELTAENEALRQELAQLRGG